AARQIGEQIDGVPKVRREGAAHRLSNEVEIAAEKRVEHQRDVALARSMSGRAPRFAVPGDLVDELLHRLSEQMRENAHPQLACLAKRIGTPRGGEPERQLRLDGL